MSSRAHNVNSKDWSCISGGMDNFFMNLIKQCFVDKLEFIIWYEVYEWVWFSHFNDIYFAQFI